MRASDRLTLIDKLGRELQARYSYEEIDSFLTHHRLSAPLRATLTNSKWVYSKHALANASAATLLKIAEELEVEVPAIAKAGARPPRNWQDSADFRLFISHISKDKAKAARLKTCLAPYAISGFVAHEDIEPTLEWQDEIERALHAMHGFIAIHTPGFSQSVWTQQEVGFAVARGIKIISLKMGEDPTGFISKRQALPRRDRTAEDIAKEVDSLLSADDLTAKKLLEAKQARGIVLADEIPF